MAGFMNAADKAILAKLTGATALTSLLAGGTANPSVYWAVAPQNTDVPYVVFQAQSPSTPSWTFGGVAIENALYTVKGVTDSRSTVSAGTIAAEIATALDDQALTIDNHTALLCRRQQDIDYPEMAPGGIVYEHRGALYRVMADPS